MLTAIAGGSVLMALIMLLLAINAITARREADIRRAQAEDLIQFMLVELRTQLEPIGKLSILDAVGDQAMTYFSALGDIGTGAEQLARAMALRQIGEVRFNQGRLDAALTAFSESRDITAALYESSHENDQILFQLGQSEFWMGYVAWNRNELRAARASMQAYYHATEELARRAPDNDEYLLEPGYAASNLGSIAREQGDYAGALVHFTDSVHTIEQLLDSSRGDRTRLLFALSESLSWLGSAQLDSGELAASEKSFRRALSILRELHQASPLASYDEAIGDQSLLLGEVLMHRGRLDEGKAALQEAGQRCSRLVRQDADNAYWQRCLHRSRAMLAEVALLQGQPEAAGSLIEQSMSGYAQLLDRDPTNSRLQQQMALAEITAAQELMLTARREEALTLASRAYRRAQEALPDTRAPASSLLRAAVVAERYGRLLHLDNQQAEASAIWREALERMGDGPETIPHTALRMQLLLDLQREREAAPLQLLLQEKGFVDPRFVSAVESVTTGAVFHAD